MPKTDDWRWFFLTTDIELTNVCHQNCSFCPRSALTRPFGYIDVPLLQKIIVQLAAIGSRITFCGMGNPLLHPDFSEIMQFCRDFDGLSFGLTIQAPALDERARLQLYQARPGFIEISMPTINPQVFAEIFPGCSFEVALEQIMKLVAHKPELRGISISTVKTAIDPSSDEEISIFWKERNLPCRIFNCHSRGGNLRRKDLVQAVEADHQFCGLFATHSFITWQGKLLSCCHDLTGATQSADLALETIAEAGKKKGKILEKGMPYGICRHCDEAAARRFIPETEFPTGISGRRKWRKRIVDSA
jgi:hypothetical protein